MYSESELDVEELYFDDMQDGQEHSSEVSKTSFEEDSEDNSYEDSSSEV